MHKTMWMHFGIRKQHLEEQRAFALWAEPSEHWVAIFLHSILIMLELFWQQKTMEKKLCGVELQWVLDITALPLSAVACILKEQTTRVRCSMFLHQMRKIKPTLIPSTRLEINWRFM